MTTIVVYKRDNITLILAQTKKSPTLSGRAEFLHHVPASTDERPAQPSVASLSQLRLVLPKK